MKEADIAGAAMEKAAPMLLRVLLRMAARASSVEVFRVDVPGLSFSVSVARIIDLDRSRKA